jgi:DNA modification methylase
MTSNLFVADIRNGLPEVADNSIDVIITDPPYPRSYLPVWSALGEVAGRVLKDGGSLYAMSGTLFLDHVIIRLRKYLFYHWIISFKINASGGTLTVHQPRIVQFWKPVVWFVKGKYNGPYVRDAFYNAHPEKKLHKWQQAIKPYCQMVECYTAKVDTVLDPFLGAGTTGLACQQLGRNFIGCDIDPQCVEITQKRLNSYQNIEKWMK